MSEHFATTHWKRETKDYAYESYDRTHTIGFGGGSKIKASSAPEFMGKAELANPEELLAGALSSCHMLTFLAVASKSRLIVNQYEDKAVAILDKNAAGKLCVTKIILRPKVSFDASTPVPVEKLTDLHSKAHKNCFIANSVACQVVLEPQN